MNRNRNRMKCEALMIGLVGAVIIFAPDPALAQGHVYMAVGSGNWTNAIWVPAPPNSTNGANIGWVGGVASPAVCDVDSSSSVTCEYLSIAIDGGSEGTLNLAGNLTPYGDVYVGTVATGTVNQTAGTWNNNGNPLFVGLNPGSVGTCNLSGGVLTNVGPLQIGESGTGILNLSGTGRVEGVSVQMMVGANAGSTGTVNQTGGTLDLNGQTLYVAFAAGSVGTYNLSGGVFTNCISLQLGFGGTGTLNIEGSTASINSSWFTASATATLRVKPDATALSPINCADPTLDGALEVDLSDYAGSGPLTVMNFTGVRVGTFAITNITGGSADVQYTANQVNLINITGGGAADSDGDGIDDAWEQSVFGDLTTADATSDNDGDGASDLHEFLAHTDPQSTGSLFAITGVAPGTGDFDIDWTGSTQSIYRIVTRTNLLSGNWVTNVSGISGASSNSRTIVDSSSALFMRIEQE